MVRYQVVARRSDRLWALYVQDVGVTQARRLTEAHAMAVDYVSIVKEVNPEDIEVDLVVEVDARLDHAVREAREATARATESQIAAAARSREVVHALQHKGLSGAEIAIVLGVSPQRVTQLKAAA